MKIDFESLERMSQDFFFRFGNKKLLGEPFFNAINYSQKNLFESLLIDCGYQKDANSFFKVVLSQIFHNHSRKIVLNGIQIPVLYLYELLSAVLPGHSLHQIKTIAQLTKRALFKTDDPDKLQQVLDQFPVRLSDHVIRQALVSEGVAKQYHPFVQELDDTGHDITFDGHFKNGLLEQMYQNRVVFLLDMQCPVYCRFCFRKHKKNRKEKTPTIEDVNRAVDHVKAHPLIKEILITGGEPLFNKSNLEAALNGLININHVQTIRIATRSIAYYPELFLNNNRAYIQYLIEKNQDCLARGKTIEIGIHLVHPDEISIQSLEIITSLVKNGIQVYVQTPFLKGLNTEGQTLARLFKLLRQAGAQIYYIFTPCSPIHGTKEYWTPISLALKAAHYLRQHVSDRCIPKFCTATPLGKIEWHTSGWAVEKDKQDKTYTWIRTPYTQHYFEQFLTRPNLRPDAISDSISDSIWGQMPDCRVNKEGTLDAKFKVDMGDDQLLLGNRPEGQGLPEKIEPEALLKRAKTAWSGLNSRPILRSSIQAVPSKHLSRCHLAIVEMDTGANKKDFHYIRNHSTITDVVLSCQMAGRNDIKKIEQIVDQLKSINHIVCVRLCIKEQVFYPGILTDKQIEAIASWADYSIGNPFRIEVETWVLLPGQVGKGLARTAQKLISKGINMYANIMLIKGVNDCPEIIVQLAHTLREARVEFHHVYVAGLSLQSDLDKKFDLQPIDDQTMIDIASKVRSDCSGREIPLYIVQTPRGEADYNCYMPE
ncbi:MAG: radical SAM protein [Pseudomonadota bacterium]